MKRFKITLTYVDQAYFERIIIVKAKNADEAEKKYDDGLSDDDFEQISNKMTGVRNDVRDEEIESIEEVK